MNWTSVLTISLTALCTILATTGVITADEGTDLTTTGGAAITGMAAFVTSLVAVIKAHKKDK